MPRALSERTFDELAADLEKRPDSLPYLQASAELHIRQIKALLEATEARLPPPSAALMYINTAALFAEPGKIPVKTDACRGPSEAKMSV